MAAMNVHDEHDDLTNDLSDDGDVSMYRARAASKLDQIIQQVRMALAEQGIHTPVFLLVPNSGNAIMTFGTITDPPDDQLGRVGEIVASIVAQSCGLIRVRRREVVCADTNSITDHQPLQGPAGCSTPSPTPVLQRTGADR